MPFGIVAYALMLFSWTTFVETAVYIPSASENEVLEKRLDLELVKIVHGTQSNKLLDIENIDI